MLKTPPGLLAVWANTYPLREGAVSSATTFHTLPSPLPVCSAFQPAGTFPTSSLPNLKARSSPSSAQTAAPASAMSATTVVHRIVRSPRNTRTERGPPLANPLFHPVVLRLGLPGQRDRAGRALPRSARQLDPAAVRGDDAAGDAQTQPGAALGPAAGLVHAVEALEDVRQMLRGDADPRVTDARHHRSALRLDLHLDHATRRRVLDGIVQQVVEDLPQPRRIASCAQALGSLDVQAQPFRLGQRTQVVRDPGHQ